MAQLLALASSLLTVVANAIADTSEQPPSAWHLSLGIGAGVRTNPVKYASDIPIMLLPQVEYSGERFFVQNLDMGFVIYEHHHHQFNLLLTPSYDQILFDRWNSGNFFVDTGNSFTGNGSDSGSEPLVPKGKGKGFSDNNDVSLHKRRMTALGGAEYNFSSEHVNWQLQWLHDVLNVHQGNEIRFLVSQDWQKNRSNLTTSVGMVWQDTNTLHYYYGLTKQETTIDNIYQPNDDISILLRLDWNYRLTEKWDLRLFTSYRRVGDQITKSPLVNDNKIITSFIGGVYHF